jgi:hypothetical protein
LEQHGIVGEIAPRQFHDPEKREEIEMRMQDYLNDGFKKDTDFCTFTGMFLYAPVEGEFANSTEMKLRNAFWNDLDEFLADTGLGYVTGASQGSGTMELDMEVVDSELAQKAILSHFSKTKYSSFNKFKIFSLEEDN